MSSRRIVLATLGTLGDVHPYLAIAIELQARGHRPVLATSEYHRQKIESAGIEFRAIRPDISLEDITLLRRYTEPKRGLERVIREFALWGLRMTYDDLLAVTQENGGADLLVSHILTFAAPIIADKTGIRWVSTELQPAAFVSAYDPPVLAPLPALAKLRGLGVPFHRTLFRFARLVAHSWTAPVRQLRTELGLPPVKDPLFAGRQSPFLVLALFSRVFAEPQPDWPANTIVTGFPFFDENGSKLTEELSRFLEDGEPPIVFTLGSSAVRDPGDFYVASAAAAHALGQRAVLLVGSDPLKQPLPPNVLAVSYVPYDQIFPRASVNVHHGGVGTTAQAMRAGRPMLVTPIGSDQYDNAARIERLGIGRTILRKQYERRVVDELRQLLENPQYKQTAMKVGQRVRSEDGARKACDAIDKLLAE
jgi:UDP:flavonoid glycosyltransferase YjiC (YdhE family)